MRQNWNARDSKFSSVKTDRRKEIGLDCTSGFSCFFFFRDIPVFQYCCSLFSKCCYLKAFMCSCFQMLLFSCFQSSCFQVFIFSSVRVFRCSCVPVFRCSCFQIFLFLDVPVFRCSFFQILMFSDSHVFQCSCFHVFMFSSISLIMISNVSFFRWSCFQITHVFRCSCFPVFLFLCSCCRNAEARRSRLCWLVLKTVWSWGYLWEKTGYSLVQSDIQVCTYHMRQNWNARDTKVSSLKTVKEIGLHCSSIFSL